MTILMAFPGAGTPVSPKNHQDKQVIKRQNKVIDKLGRDQ